MDSGKENAFLIYKKGTNDLVTKFKKDSNRLCTINASEPMKYGEEIHNSMNSVNENVKLHTSRQYSDAKRARDLHHKLGEPSIDSNKMII